MYSNSYYDYSTSAGLGAAAGALVGFFMFFAFIMIAFAVFYVISLWKVFKKAGKNGWEAIIPIYNSYVLFEISGYPGWYIFLIFIPFAGSIIVLVFEIMAYISLAKKFGKSEAFGVLSVFFPIICFPILAFGSATYDSSLGENKIANNIEKQEETEEKNTSKKSKEKVQFCSNCGKKLNIDDKVCSECGTNLKDNQ